jgi:hypothetical protein
MMFMLCGLLAGFSFKMALGCPVAYLDKGTFVGTLGTTGNVSKFLGIPYALPPYVSHPLYFLN